MPTYFRRDDWVVNNFIQAIPNASVTYYVQPSLALATIYANSLGSGGPIANPQTTDGFGHTAAYMDPGIYTISYSGEQIVTQTLPDQVVGGPGGGGSVSTFSGTPQGTIDGTNRVFLMTNGGVVLTAIPTQYDVWLNFPLIPSVGYTVALVSGQVQITYAVAPQIGDTLYDEGIV